MTSFKIDILMPPDWYGYEKHSAEILQLYLSFYGDMALFVCVRNIQYIPVPKHITLAGHQAK